MNEKQTWSDRPGLRLQPVLLFHVTIEQTTHVFTKSLFTDEGETRNTYGPYENAFLFLRLNSVLQEPPTEANRG